MSSRKSRLTNNADETDISTLLEGENIFVIPFFQRPYKWAPERIRQLNQDLVNLLDGSTDIHFLGAVIVHGRSSNPSDPTYYEVIDGQQRITTLFLYICAAVKILCEEREYEDADALFLKYLVIGRSVRGASNVKLHSSKDDRAQLNYVVEDLLSDKEFKKRHEKASIKTLPSSGRERGPLRTNYRLACEFFRDQLKQGKIDAVRQAYTALLNKVSVVQIDVVDPTNGPKIFDGLNSRQQPMTIGDLVRNEIFSKVADEEPEQVERIDRDDWQPFYKKFQQGNKNFFEEYFFPYGLTQDANLRKSEIYGRLRDDWEEVSTPAEIIKELSRFQDAFLDIVCGQNYQEHSKVVAAAFFRLYELGAPGSTYPFLMLLSNAIKEGEVSEKDGLASLDVIESFLVRRAICGHEPTGLHAVFKKLWGECGEAPDGDSVEAAIRKRKTVVWPDDDELERAVKGRPLYGAAVTSYILAEYDRSLKGDVPDNIPWIEHVLPEKPVDAWLKKFTKEQHEKMKDLLANLIPLHAPMNSSLGNREYSVKKPRYEEDSMFKTARKFAKDYEDWTPELLEERAEGLSEWAVERWPH